MTSHGIAIQHGFILPATTNLFELTRTLDTILAPVQRQLQIKDIAFHAARILDEAELAGIPRPSSVIFDALQAHNEHALQILAGEHSCPLTSLVTTVFEGGSSEALYLVAHVRFEEQLEALVEAGLGEYAPYWDEVGQARRPAGVPAATWQARGAAWARALQPVDGDPTAPSITVDVGDPTADIDLISEVDAVLAAIPSVEDRVGHILSKEGNGTFSSPAEMMAFMANMPGRVQDIQSRIKAVSLTDLNGVLST